jgi:lysophospholipase L1-like esterase
MPGRGADRSARKGVKGGRSTRHRVLAPVLLLLFGTLVGLLLAEATLRVAGFEYRGLPTVQFGWPRPEEMVDAFRADRDLFWVPLDYKEVLAQARIDRPAIAFLGDSCTQLGSYSMRTLARLAKVNPRLSTGVNLGVAGWSAVQGLAQLERDVLPIQPLVVTLYFGWNDHWTALGPPDDEARPTWLAWHLSERSRLAQLVFKAWLAADLKPVAERSNRVNLTTYEATLREMARRCRESGVRPVVITAPSGHRQGREPAYLARRHLRRLDELVPLHRLYVEATRRAAREGGAVLCDAAAAFEQAGARRRRYFHEDGIHLTTAGDQALADLLAGCIVDAMGPRSGTATLPGRERPPDRTGEAPTLVSRATPCGT